MSKYFYIDEQGNKKKYIGSVTFDDKTNTYIGFLTKQQTEHITYNITFHEPIEGVEGYSSYYTYINNNGKEIKYYGNVMESNGVPYFTYSVNEPIYLTFHEIVKETEPYYTYTYNGDDILWTNKVMYDKKTSTYYGIK